MATHWCLIMTDLLDRFYGSSPDWQVAENANRGGLEVRHWGKFKTYVAETTIGSIADQYYSPDVVRAHKEGALHCHDYKFFTIYCIGWPTYDVMSQGLHGLPGNPVSKPPKHFHSALMMLADFVFLAQLEQAGAVGLGYLTSWLAPLAKRDRLDYRDVYKAIYTFLFRVNQRLRPGFECPFTNTSHLFHIPDEYAMWSFGGVTLADAEDYYWMIEKAWFQAIVRGDALGNPFSFPLPTVMWHKDIPQNQAFDSMIYATRMRGIPYFQNLVSTGLKPTDVTAFCCRLQLDLKEVQEVAKARGFFGVGIGATGSIGVVTLNLPWYAWLSRGDDERFFEILDHFIDIGCQYLLERENIVRHLMSKGAFPLFWTYIGQRNQQQFGDPLATFFRTFGVVGGHEMCLNMNIEDGIVSKEGHQFAIRVLKHIRKRLTELSEQHNRLFNLEETPAESASYRLWRLTASGTPCYRKADDCYINSTHLPPEITDLTFIIKHQEPLKQLYNGGTVLHIDQFEFPPHDTCAKLIQAVCHKTKIPYFTINVCFSHCPTCHRSAAGYVPSCPECGQPMDVYHRVVGYYRRVSDFHPGKQEEFRRRRHKEVKVDV